MSAVQKTLISYGEYHKQWIERIKRIFESATFNNSYKYENMIRYSADLDLTIYESLKIKSSPKLAAHFLHRIATRHPFLDGNKRAALLLGLTILATSMVTSKIKKKDFPDFLKRLTDRMASVFIGLLGRTDWGLVDFMVETADGKHSVDEIRKFLKITLS